MAAGGSTPEELETLLEDAFLQRDARAVAELFEDDGVLLAGANDPVQAGSPGMWRTAAVLCGQCFDYVAGTSFVWRSGDTALLLGERAVSLARRGRDGSWRYLLCCLGSFDEGDER